MFFRWIMAVLILPGTVLVLIPLLLLSLFGTTGSLISQIDLASPLTWLGTVIAFPSFALSLSSMLMFIQRGEGTAAPWDPPQKLVISGPYRFVRNPMISGVIGLLLAEALILQSPAIGIWAAAFAIGNTIYFPLSEEPGLISRFGEEYVEYSRHVGRWIPRLIPWKPASHDQTAEAQANGE